jgi:hypothetical protein
LKTPEIPINEAERLKALSEYRILGTKPEQNYDDITKIASLTCDTPIALPQPGRYQSPMVQIKSGR